MRSSRIRQIELLWSVTGADRCAGVVRYELAGLEDLEHEQMISLRLHAMNREQYPRFFRGTYRLCMSLEMIAAPGYTFFNPAAARVILDETLDILYRAGRTPIDRCGDNDIHVWAGKSGPSVLSHALRETLLSAALRDLRVIRRHLSVPVVVWNTFSRELDPGADEPVGAADVRHRHDLLAGTDLDGAGSARPEACGGVTPGEHFG